jgi:hypothetical protein
MTQAAQFARRNVRAAAAAAKTVFCVTKWLFMGQIVADAVEHVKPNGR